MKLSLIVMGVCGRMGATVARLAQEQGIRLGAVVERPEKAANLGTWPCPSGDRTEALFEQAPGAVVIDFTAPEATMNTARLAARLGHPMVIGTTGLTAEQRAELEELARQTPIFLSPNMSVGINVLLQVLPTLARMLGEGYDVEMVELHHNRKRDAPSGTALRLADCLAGARDWDLDEVSCCGREGLIGERPHRQIGIQAVRGGDVVGVHTVYFMGPGERIEVTHQAHSRENFAQGALRAAAWLIGQKPGRLYDMGDVLRGDRA